MADPSAPPALPPHVRARLRVALSTPALRRCQLAPAVARLVDMGTLVVVSVHLFGRTGPGAVAAFVAIRTFAPAIGTPFVLAAAGRRAPGPTLAWCAAVAGAASAATALVMEAAGPAAMILVLGGVAGTALCCLRPLVVAVLPGHIVGPAQLIASNSMAALADNVSTLAGPLLAGAALATAGPSVVLWASAALLGIVAASVFHLGSPVLATHPRTAPVNVVRVAAGGFRVLTGTGLLRLVTFLTASQTFVRGALNVLVVALAIDQLDLGDGGVGLLLGAIGVGGLVGLPLAVRIAHAYGMGRSLGVALMLWGAPIVVTAYTPHPSLTVVLFVVIGVGNDLIDITSDTLLQRLVPRASLPSTLGAFDAVLYAGMALGAVAAERLMTLADVRSALVVVGLLLPALAVATWGSLRAVDLRVRERDAAAAFVQVHGIFSCLVMSTVDSLADSMQHQTFAAGEPIIRKGDEGDRYLLIESGTVEVVDDGELLAVLGPGDGFGELALLEDAPRNASAIARSPVSVRSLRRDDFLGAVRSQSATFEAARTVADERRRSPARAAPERPYGNRPGDA